MALPDVEALIVHYLTGAVDGLYVCTVRPDGTAFTALLPLAQITRVGGPRTIPTWNGRYVAEDARVSVDVYATSREAANASVGTVRLALESLRGRVTQQGTVSRTWEETGPTARPEEPNTNVVRIGWTAGLTIRST
ncbi:hypothetical protein V2S66_03285 [Streptomyces sp. V4-01]|uniref:DUF3168 domain-containing protein n=1 Tax=Actinacidiphila polyblastidii TaxID=3110430 RepID=A0ABU7P5B4_9ACTN|nr:hypothetical protein [Streptomyces sp. V4-01]